MRRRTAIIDLGTNTFNLLIAEHDGKNHDIIFQEKYPVKLGQSGIHKQVITPEAFQRGIRQILKINRVIEQFGVNQTTAIATSAIRHASNREEFVQEVFQRTGIRIRIINGSKEAEFIYFGVRTGIALKDSNSLIMDIGGGSTEFIIANQNGLIWKRSFKLGAARLQEIFTPSNPMTEEECIKMCSYLKSKLRPLYRAQTEHRAFELIGSSGSFDTFADILFCRADGNPFPPQLTSYKFPNKKLRELLSELISKNRKERLAIPGMLSMRVDMIGIAALFTLFILDEFQLKNCRLSTYSLKEGVLQTIKSQP